jgi:hypothetical protein
MPNIEGVCLTALVDADLRAYSSIPSKNSAVYPLLTLKRLGGTPPVKQKLDMARIQVDSWGGTLEEARDLADEARQLIFALEGTTSEEWAATVTLVQDSVGLTYLQDPVTKRDRYTFDLNVYAYTAT